MSALPFLRPATELAANRPHGDRMRYLGGCRCAACRKANSAYESERQRARKAGDWNGLVPADKAREHILALSAAGVGRNQVADAAGLSRTMVCDLRSGAQTKLRARNERAILAVTAAAAADGMLVDAAPTWRLLRQLIAMGYTRSRLAKELGMATRALQIGKQRCTLRNEYEVQRLYERLRRVRYEPTARLIAALREEGFNQYRITKMLGELAARDGVPAPDLSVTAGFISASAAAMVHRLHSELTTEPA